MFKLEINFTADIRGWPQTRKDIFVPPIWRNKKYHSSRNKNALREAKKSIFEFSLVILSNGLEIIIAQGARLVFAPLSRGE